MKDKLIKFIKENKLVFSEFDSGLNGACTVLAGYADFVRANKKVVRESIKEAGSYSHLPIRVEKEINRVYDFASTYNYGNWWKRDEAKKLYKF